ncbi:MAG: putative CocE/NonD family hydrolase [Candidatus Latescibacterota bacterium]|jgi:putative CocE/NonD family hydrolase
MHEFASQEGVRFIKNIMIPTSDGTHLAMDLHVPDNDHWQKTQHPIIVEYIPYRKDDAPPYSGHHHTFAKHGFIGARIDCRGTGSSEGTTQDEYTQREQQDGAEAIDWIGQQPWSNGKVAMFGASYGGFTAVQVAALHPKHLTTIIPMYFTDDRYTDECHYRGGNMRCYYDIGAYGASMIGMNAMPPYPEYVDDNWADLWKTHLEGNEPYLLQWLSHQTDGPYWRPGSIRDRYENIQCPVFMIGGWRDGYATCNLRTFQHLTVPKKVLIGPWNHSRPDVAIPGPRITYLTEVIRWCEHWLKNEDNGVMDESPITLYMQTYDTPKANRTHTSGYWRIENQFPVHDHTERRLYLSENASLNAHDPDYNREKDTYVYHPTVGLSGGLWSAGVPFGLPTDQRPDEIYALTYTTEKLDVPLEIIGQPKIELHVSSTAEVMAYVVKLCDVAPDGTSALVCSGVLNGTRRESLTDPKPMTPGEIYKLSFALDATAYRFEPKHRIRISISSADFPNLWPTPYAGTNTILRGQNYPSRLILPIAPTKDIKNEVAFEPSQTKVKPYHLSPNKPVWEVTQDIMQNRTGVKLHTQNTTQTNETTKITNKSQLTLSASNENPADVSGTGHHHRKITRTDGETEIDSSYTIRSTATAFHTTIDLNITINGLPHFQKQWTNTFPRDLL